MRPRGFLRTHRRLARRLCASGAGLAVTLAVLPAATGMLPVTRAVQARADETTISQDKLRTNWDPNEPAMDPTTVKNTFTQLFATKVTGQVYAQPLVVNGTLIVATEKDHVYGLNPVTGAVKWNVTLGKPYKITTCHDLTPDVGVTGGPVYNPGTGLVYMMAQVLSSTGTPMYKLFGINPAKSGAVAFTRTISGRAANDSAIKFSAKNQMPRPGLLLLDGSIFAAFGSHCDHQPYVGYVARVNLSSKALTLWSDETGTTTNQAGIWQGGAGVMSDGPGRIFVTSGNGISPGPVAPGSSGLAKPPGHLAESVVRLSDAGGGLKAVDFFSPANAPSLDAADTDWGSGGPVGLPFGTSTYPHVLAQIGKDSHLFLLNRNGLGGRSTSNNNRALSVSTAFKGEWGHPAVFADTSPLSAANAGTANNYLFYLGKGDSLRWLKFGVNGSDKPVVSDVANSQLVFGYSSGPPEVTSSGSDINSAVVWAVYSSGSAGTGGMLVAYPANPGTGCTSSSPCVPTQIKSWNIGTASKFSNLATSNGRVYVGTRLGATTGDGTVYGFGNPVAAAPLNTGAQTNFGQTPVNSTATRDVTVTATSAVTVTGVTASTQATTDTTSAPQFTVDQAKVTETAKGSSTATPVTFPVTLHKGDKLSAPVTYAPASPGGTSGSLTFATNSARFPAMDAALTGDGTTSGLYSSPGSLHFALVNDVGIPVSDVPAGISVPLGATITNGSDQPQTISSVTLPSGPFQVSGMPAVGTVLQPGQSIVVQVTFSPTAAASYSDSLSVSAGGSTATVSLAGVGLAPHGLFTASPTSVNFGPVAVGKKVTTVVDITNTGNEPALVASATTLNAPFLNKLNVTPMMPINAGYDVKIPVSFVPTKTGAFSAVYHLTWTDVTGSHTVSVNISGVGK
ncbi:MAG: choice-of-anchor D domain-containing protein [Gemmatimonadota bacterium]